MGGRRFGQHNAVPPACVIKLAEKPPECFNPAIWKQYLIDCYRGALNEPATRQRMTRGIAPDYCSECLPDHRARMQAQNKCHPPTNRPNPENSNAA